ncbi:carboxypeptidase-like regulatory domain-containing protein, partial [bacterium]|nr:carboxypeptidase-like regulatory domain-containing protein [bacterium]
MLGLWVVLLSYMEILAGTTGKITGRITDEATHEGLPGTNVIVVGTAIGATSDAEGYYTIINVPPGQCDLAASMVGYARTTVQGVKVNIDRTTVQNIVLSQ